ncbi:MAG: TetR/AcrR family transcriptional regulator [Candidatus Nanopelagicales bacterium]|nr:TetR/AcrR family transcriptional regulator [Candidatus Nanopelagicales bacterium]
MVKPQPAEEKRIRLNREVICCAAAELLAQTDAATFSLRALGDRLGVDATAFYRHFADKDDLLRELGDRSLAPATRGFQPTDDARDDIRRMCLGLRRTLLRDQVGLSITSLGPTRRANELKITEILLDALMRAGLATDRAAMVYHVFIEYTVGSAALDAPLAAKGARRGATYRQWRADYQNLAPSDYPAINSAFRSLYPSSDQVFEEGLEALIGSLVPPRAALR